MPTAIDFDLAAMAFDAAAASTASLLSGVDDLAGPSTLSGGGLTLLTDVTIDAADRTATSTADRLRGMGDTCRIRAEACRTYADALGRYERAVDRWRNDRADLPAGEPPPTHPVRPRSPGPWAEV